MKGKSMFRKFLGAVALMLFLGSPAWAITWYVDGDVAVSGDGTSWETAFRTIQEAVNAASPYSYLCMSNNQNIWVKRGTYNLTSQLNVNKVVKILGGFYGNETSSTQRNYTRYRTIIDGGDSVRCLYITASSTIDGFTIRNGATTASGGGIYIYKGVTYCSTYDFYNTPRIANCVISGNSASTGGGVYIYKSDPVFYSCTFQGNSSQTGGAVYHSYSSPDFERCTFTDNTSTAPGSLGGGAIAGYQLNTDTNETVSITNCLFYGNISGSWGGAISYNQVYPTIANCTFSLNEADIAGGGFHGNTNSEAPKIRNAIFWNDYPDELDITTASTYLDVRYSNIQGGWSGSEPGNIDEDPNFVSATNFRLMSGSPCIDAGSNYYGGSVDLSGHTRPLDGDEDGAAITDMGAYEYDPDALPFYPAPIIIIKSSLTLP